MENPKEQPEDGEQPKVSFDFNQVKEKKIMERL